MSAGPPDRDNIRVAGIVWHSMPRNSVAEYTAPNGARCIMLLGEDPNEVEAIRAACKAPTTRVERHVREMVAHNARAHDAHDWILRWDADKGRTYIEKRSS